MISNPDLPAYRYYEILSIFKQTNDKTPRYDPYSRVFSREGYDTPKMHSMRTEAIATARQANKVGIILGTLGRQGSVSVLNKIEACLKKRGTEYIVVLLSEIFPTKLEMFRDVGAYVIVLISKDYSLIESSGGCKLLALVFQLIGVMPLLLPYSILMRPM